MTIAKEQWAKLKQLFAEGVARYNEDADNILHGVCGDDAILGAEVQSLLKHHQIANKNGFLLAPSSDEIASRHTLTNDWSDTESPAEREPNMPPEWIGKFRVERLLGEGGFAQVYLAYDEDLKRQVAIKVLRREKFRTDSDLEQFIGDARTAEQLRHPGIVRVHHIDRDESGDHFIALEYMQGGSLADLFEQDGLSQIVGVQILADVAEALHHAHKQGFVHRDLTPSNILLDEEARPRVADFGLAVHEDIQNLRAGEIAGSPPYMSPEQVRGETQHLDGRTDIWSLGVILYELLVGRRPFRGNNWNEIFVEVLNREPKPPRMINDGISSELEAICLKCLAKPVGDRYTNAADLASDLKHAQSQFESKSRSVESDVPQPASNSSSKEQLSSIIRSPAFHYGGVVPPEYFINRVNELANAKRILEGGHSFLLVGKLRAGKTSFIKMLIHQMMSRPENDVLAVYLNVQQWPSLTIETFLEHTILNIIGEMARQVFGCKFTSLASYAKSLPSDDKVFRDFIDVYQSIRQRTYSRGAEDPHVFEVEEFVNFHTELIEIVRQKGWRRCVVFYDEANRLPQSLSVDLLMSHQEAFNMEGISSVYAASPKILETFHHLRNAFGYELNLGPFTAVNDMQRLLARYYFDDTSRIADLPVDLTAIDLLWAHSHGEPFLIQMMAGRAFEFAKQQGANRVDDEHIGTAFRAVKAEKPTAFQEAARKETR